MTKEDIAALKRGERTAQREFLCRYAEGVFAFITRMVNNQQDAEELTQDTLLKALRSIDRYDATRASITTWLRSIAYRTTINHLRRPTITTIAIDRLTANAPEASDNDVLQAFQTPDDATAEYLCQALDYLPPDERALINLFYYDDLPLREIAEIVDAPPGTLATRLHRTRKKLFSIIHKLKNNEILKAQQS